MNDIRYNEEWLPMDQSQNSESRAAEVMRYQNIIDGCKSEMCLQLMCSPPLICVDLWRYAECRFVFLILFLIQYNSKIHLLNYCMNGLAPGYLFKISYYEFLTNVLAFALIVKWTELFIVLHTFPAVVHY